jgi:hypothetical protein
VRGCRSSVIRRWASFGEAEQPEPASRDRDAWGFIKREMIHFGTLISQKSSWNLPQVDTPDFFSLLGVFKLFSAIRDEPRRLESVLSFFCLGEH